MQYYDKVIIGAGLYGLYSALFCGRRGQKVLILEHDVAPFRRATYINQARVHSGYHYPRSLTTALKSAGYFDRFVKDYGFCINYEFKKIYATASEFSWTNAEQFRRFCEVSDIPCEEVNPEKFFKKGMCGGAFLTLEYAYDAILLRNYFMEQISALSNVEMLFDVRLNRIGRDADCYQLDLKDGKKFRTKYVLNATYASTNQILDMLDYEKIKMKYELCEIILCDVSNELKEYGITVMDGPFFSIMPFGKTGIHSLTSVTFTPHVTSYDLLPKFSCQNMCKDYCNSKELGNCNECIAKPESAFPYMSNLARKFLREEYKFTYRNSLFSMKPILINSELDDSRPTVIRTYSKNPTFVSVLSGKINTVYDLDEVLEYGE